LNSNQTPKGKISYPQQLSNPVIAGGDINHNEYY